ncbi:type I restriction-modification system subunit M N-terminal domain-containing protein [Sphaerisporangium sp. NPDC088356]|uniref:type I restriction-modification system subunit M N-terminal domain-containing protein n=1 Tax=Sphaerisporangium sp. NPDC088356 TaxID=3154871 RepID=UPI00341B7472
MNHDKVAELVNHAWSVTDLPRGDDKQADHGKVILPFTVLRRLECVLAPTRDKVLAEVDRLSGRDLDMDRFLLDLRPVKRDDDEYRQSLITAAVTGQFEVSTAGGRGMDVP